MELSWCVLGSNGNGGAPCEFNAELIRCMQRLPKPVREEAHYDMSPLQMRGYANRLYFFVDDVGAHAKPNLKAAIGWLRYWAERGVQMQASC